MLKELSVVDARARISGTGTALDLGVVPLERAHLITPPPMPTLTALY